MSPDVRTLLIWQGLFVAGVWLALLWPRRKP